MTIELIDRVLAASDPAAGLVARRDPERLLRDIVETHSNATSKVAGRRPGRRAVLVAAAAAVVLGIPVFMESDNAYAGWTAYPAALSTGQTSAVAKQCQRWTDMAGTRVVLSERRGDIGFALLAGPSGLIVTCQQRLAASGEPNGGASRHYLPQHPDPAAILSDGGWAFAEDDGEPVFRVVTGRVGGDVTDVVVQTAEQGAVTATVEHGYFTAWWPGPPEPGDGFRSGLPMDFTFSAQLRDGTTKVFTRAETRS